MVIRRFFLWSLTSLISGLVVASDDLLFGTKCPSSDNENILQVDNIYTYRFRSEALAQSVGTTDDHGKIVLECDVTITHVRDCFYAMDLQRCQVTAAGGEPGSQTAWIDHLALPELSKYSVAFSLSNGEIREVKTHEDDPLYYVNIKRGVLSAFVFKLSQTEKKLQESHTDIHGICPLTSVPEDGTVKTSKDMLHCNFPSRPDWQLSPWSLFWNMSFIQHVINSTTDCEYKINNEEKRIEKVFCKERHAIMLESTHRTTAAVQTNVFYNLDFVDSRVKTADQSLPALTKTTDIRYEYEHTPVPQSSPSNFLAMAKKMLSDLVLDSLDEIRLFAIPQFTEFVGWIRSSHDLGPLVDSVKDCSFLPEGVQCDQKIKDLAYSYLSDALLQCNNIPCMKSLTYLAVNDDLSPTYLDLIFHSWSYMHFSKPGFITNFVEICRLKNSHQCWMSLGSFIRRIYTRSDRMDEKILDEVREVSSYFYNTIKEECEVTEDTNKLYTNCLIFLKAASDIGKHYAEVVPDAVEQFLEVATDEYALVVVRTSALEALKDVCDPAIQDQRHQIYDKLLPLLQNVSLPASVRLLSYDLLVLTSEDYSFEEHLVKILKEEKNAEVKYYIADNLNSLMTDHEFKSKREKFLDSLDELLSSSNLSLELILYETKGKSKASSQSVFLKFPFMPDYMKQFGLKLRDSFIYDSYIYPTVIDQETILQLFSTFLPTMKLSSYFEGWEELIMAYKKNLADMNTKSVSFPMIVSAVMKTLGEHGKISEESLRNFDENIIANIKKLQHTYWEHHKKLNPYAKAYMDLFGSTIKYYIQDSLQSDENSGIGKILHSIQQRLAEGVTLNTTRVIRIVEAYHQVPTMMGLPLNWTTNATLAFSIRAGLKYQMNDKDNNIYSKGFLQPSAALTFLNRMVLDFPTLTQIGVQANSSGYTSTELRVQYNSAKDKQKLRFERPSRTQKVLELFRTNQLIKHNSYEDIPDWDIERTTSSWCTKQNSAFGLKACLSKSYPKVTHRIKPWALMAGSCKWQFLVHPTSSNNVHYDIEVQEQSKQKQKEVTAKFSITENDREKSAHLKAVMDESGKEVKLDLRTSLMPDFSASLSRSELSKGKKVSGHKIEGVLKLLKDFKYELEYSNEGKVQKPSVKTSSPPSENSQTLVNEMRFKLKTPYSSYDWNKTLFKLGENIKSEASLSYENTNAKTNWMKNILPPAFWEDDKKASMKVRLHWKKPIYKSGDVVTRETEFRLEVPWYIMTLNGKGLESDARQQIMVNLAKTDIREGKLDTFLNFTYDSWLVEYNAQYEKMISSVNVTIPRRSWSAQFQKIRDGTKIQQEVKLKRALMKPINDVKNNYVGWWSDEVSDSFRIEEREIKLVANHEFLPMDSTELANRYSTVTSQDLEGLRNQLIVSNVALYYPMHGRIESVIFDGYFILSKQQWEVFRFQKDFDLTSSYNNLKLTSHSVYRSESDSSILYHNSFFTHMTSETKAHNTIHYVSRSSRVKCSDIEFQHDIRSHVFDLSTDATLRCETEVDGLHTLRLKLNTNSSMWNMLDIKLDQIIEDVSPVFSREEMTTTHATGTIHVDAEWHTEPKHSQKRVVLCSKDGNCPNAELSIENWPLQRIIKFNRNDYEISYNRKMSSDRKIIHINVGYGHKIEGDSELLDLTGELIAPNYHVWKGTLDAVAYSKVKEIVSSGYAKFQNAFAEIASDKDHPLNTILRPALKMTLYDYWKGVKTEFQEFVSLSWAEVKEIFYTVDAFVEPAYDVFISSISSINGFFRDAYNSLKEKSITIWAIDYFHLPYYLQHGFSGLPQALTELWNQLALGQENILHFKFVTGRIIALTSFMEWPSLSFNPDELANVFSYETKATPSRSQYGVEKVAMLFGPLHVYTFDGHLYDVPAYPDPDCTFLLAHDVYGSLFTVLSYQKGIHLLFPEMSVTINDRNEVFVNGSRQPSPLPIQASNGKVTIKRGNVVEVWSPSLSVICRSQDFLCILKLSEYHTGGVMGLLGNADEYSTNDFMLPSGNTSNLLEFARTYEISGKPECKNLVLTSVPSWTEEEKLLCNEKLGSICYAKSDIRQKFLEACVADIKAGHAACYSAAGLSALCNLKYTPSHTECNFIKQGKVNIGRNLEVVLVVQESKYLTSPDKSNSPIKGIESLIKAVDDRFKEAGYESIKYSLVGFGGHGVHYKPTLHSSEKDIWMSADEMVRDGLKTLEFRSREGTDSVQALKYALEELGHDTYGSKVFVVITAKDKQVAEKPLVDSIQRDLEQNGITLYTLSSYPSIEKGKKVFGVRADGLIFPSQTKDGDAYLDYPRGNLAKLTSSTRGSVFLTKFLQDNKPPAFFAEFAQEVWAKVNREAEMCRRCKSVRRSWWWYRNECNIVSC